MNHREHRHNNGDATTTVGGGGSSSSWSDLNNSSSSNSNSNSHFNPPPPPHQPPPENTTDPMQSWWESVSKARTRIRTLISLLPGPDESLSSLADSDRPGRALLSSHAAYLAVSSSLSGAGDDPLCHWLYDTFQDSDSDSDLMLVVLSIVPIVAGLYLTRIYSSSTTTPSASSPSLAGFEAVLLAVYSSQTKLRAGQPILVSIPTPAHLAHHPSLYHHPHSPTAAVAAVGVGVGVLSPALEPQVGIKSTKRATIVGVAFHCFYSHISVMPSWAKLEVCEFAGSFVGPLPWELLQPVIRILGHCLLGPTPLVSEDVRESASVAVARLYERALLEVCPQAILATRSLLQLHARASADVVAVTDASSVPATPTSTTNNMLLISN